jgi:hypothetical protein
MSVSTSQLKPPGRIEERVKADQPNILHISFYGTTLVSLSSSFFFG